MKIKVDNCIFEAPEEVLEKFYEKEESSKNGLQTRNKALQIRSFLKKDMNNVENIQRIETK